MREIGLLGLVALITWTSASQWVTPEWTPADSVPDATRIWASVGGAVLTTLLRLRSPTVAVIAATAQFGWWPASGIAVAVAAFRLCGQHRSVARRFTVLQVAAVTGYGVAVLSSPMPTAVVTMFHLSMSLVCLGLPVGVRALLGTADRVILALRERALFLEENYRLAQSTARLEERSRIAQEMHDQLGHRLSLIAQYAGALELASMGRSRTARGEEDGESGAADGGEAGLIRGTAQTAMRELRLILGVLRSTDHQGAALRPVEETGLRTDIAGLVGQSRSAGVDVGLRWRGDDLREVAAPVRRAVHRVVLEGLTNVHRHACGAVVTVVVERGRDTVRVEVRNGRAPRPVPGGIPLGPGTGMGLVGVQERVALLGGVFSAGPTEDDGFRLSAELPLRAPVVPVSRTGRVRRTETVVDDRVPPVTSAPVKSVTSFGHWVRLGTSAVFAVGLVGVAALVAVSLYLVPWSSAEYRSLVDRPLSEAVTPGMTRDEVTSVIGADDPVARLAAQAVESPPSPAGPCLYSTEWLVEQQVVIVRFCFREDRLIGVDRYEIGADGAETP
ncbi:histidine kinase [Streptomyces sp. NPDC047061]|uniref:sensor histidine kinase n=1 Tax=Streptomyces sp. NPDC047061 TaxID=3154605 RepID=UPI003405EB64